MEISQYSLYSAENQVVLSHVLLSLGGKWELLFLPHIWYFVGLGHYNQGSCMLGIKSFNCFN